MARLKESVAKRIGLRSGWTWMTVNPSRKEVEGMEEGSVELQVKWDTEAAHGIQKQTGKHE